MYNKNWQDVVKEFDSNEVTGLTQEEAVKRQNLNGFNEIEGKKKESIIIKFFKQFADILIIILIIAAIVSFVIEPSEWIESVIIFIVIIINAILGVIQENKAEKSLEALEKMSSPLCKVIRDGEIRQLVTKELVVGDIIILEAGDYVPADARLFECSNLQVDESALTGESVAVNKNIATINKDNIPLGDMKNLVFSSTFITNGRGKAVVTAIGMKTEIGKIANMLKSDKKQTTPLQDKLAQVGKIIGLLCVVICLIVFILEYIASKDALESFKTAVALAVAAVPEGLATVVTIVLAIGVNNMAKQKAIVKKLPAVETLGSTSIVCSDKTGTLTQNKMTVVEVYRKTICKLNDLNEEDREMIQYFALCSDAKISFIDGEEKRIGDPTETALIELNNKYGKDINNIVRVGDVPFDSNRKMMTVVCKIGDKFVSITKGAPDIVIGRSNNTSDLYYALQVNDNMAVRALRVLGLGIKVFDKKPESIDESLENDLQFLGLVGMIDPSRPEVKDAIKIAQKAGIRTIMITGDHVTTAKAIATELGIFREGDKAITSSELALMSEEDLANHIEEYTVYARIAPEDKVRIVEEWQKRGKVVAMTGDGVNDSPALKHADIGCAMGITGTEVAKEAADMILVDDNFSTIINAVKEGRGIYSNIKKCVKYLLSSNIGEVLTIFLASVISLIPSLALGVPLLPIHLLWINLITDSLPAFGLGMEKTDLDIMNDKPREKKEGFFAGKLGIHIALEGVMIGLLTLTAYLIGSLVFKNHTTGQTMAFLTLSSLQLFHSFNVKTEHSLFSKKTFNNRFLNMAFIVGFALQFAVIYIPGLNNYVFKLEALSIDKFMICMGLSFGIVIIMEIVKLFGYHKK